MHLENTVLTKMQLKINIHSIITVSPYLIFLGQIEMDEMLRSCFQILLKDPQVYPNYYVSSLTVSMHLSLRN